MLLLLVTALLTTLASASELRHGFLFSSETVWTLRDSHTTSQWHESETLLMWTQHQHWGEHTHAHTHTHTRSLTLTLPHTHTHTRTRAHSHSHSLTHTHTHTHTHALALTHTLSHTLTHTHTHTRAHAHTLSHTHSLSLSHTHTHTLVHSCTRTHTHSHTRTHTHTHAHAHTRARTHTRAHTHTHSLTHTHSHSLTHTLSLSLSHTHTHSLSLSLSHTHTHTHTHTLRLWEARTCTGAEGLEQRELSLLDSAFFPTLVFCELTLSNEVQLYTHTEMDANTNEMRHDTSNMIQTPWHQLLWSKHTRTSERWDNTHTHTYRQMWADGVNDTLNTADTHQSCDASYFTHKAAEIRTTSCFPFSKRRVFYHGSP